jgi:hypothetical protein
MAIILTKLAIVILVRMKFPLLALLALPAFAQGTLDSLIRVPLLDAHNCYPYQGRFLDRIERALKTGFPVGIEQDLTWQVDPATGKGRAVVSHSEKALGGEPELRAHFFERVRPIVEQALKENNRSRWPLIVVHFDFKSVTPPLLHAVWDLLGEYPDWITTAPKSADPRTLTPFDVKPLLVLTEDADAQEAVFYTARPTGSKLRLFGSAHTRAIPSEPRTERDHLLATLSPSELLSAPSTTYRRWWNTSWFTVEEGGQRKAGDWTTDEDRRLRALVDHAHKLGYWIRFYTLDGFPAGESQSKGWDQNYNFGSAQAVEQRWKAALAAGVNLIATDQYEALATFMKASER